MKIAGIQTLNYHHLLDKAISYYELTKPGITFTVLGSMLMGFILAPVAGIHLPTLIHAVIGTYAIAAGTAAHNQFIERHLDRLMNRTSNRPLPTSKVTPGEANRFSLLLIFGGLIYLLALVNWKAGLVSGITTLLYLGAYTPMKRVSAWNVVIGSIPGALPPVGGWLAAGGSFADIGMWLLFAIVFFWQIPHVMSIAWVCLDDYNNAGFTMIPKNDKTGIKTAWAMLINLIALLPIIYAVFHLGMGHWPFLIISGLATLAFTSFGTMFLIHRTKKSAKFVMFGSFVYLPLIWLAFFADILLLYI